jgi:alkylation response protein AidB-like acyl-CoA dehydrogenase
VVTEGGEPVVGPAPGVPAITWIGLPASEWTIEDTWFVSGLKGTGSSHVSIKDAFAPTANEFNLFGASHLPGPLYSAPSILSLLTHCGPALGIAEGALADLVAMANAGRQQAASRTSMRDSPLFQAELGRVEAEVRAARAMTESQAASHWRRAKAGETHNDAWAIEGFQTIVWVTLTCQRAVDACYALGGGQALYETSALQRRLRDIHAVTQHVAAQPKHYLAAGELKLGFPPRNPILG